MAKVAFPEVAADVVEDAVKGVEREADEPLAAIARTRNGLWSPAFYG